MDYRVGKYYYNSPKCESTLSLMKHVSFCYSYDVSLSRLGSKKGSRGCPSSDLLQIGLQHADRHGLINREMDKSNKPL